MTLSDYLYLFGASSSPTPSLCDTCRHAGHIPGGSVSVGGKTYAQRYCGMHHIGIHDGGRQTCVEHTPKAPPVAAPSS